MFRFCRHLNSAISTRYSMPVFDRWNFFSQPLEKLFSPKDYDVKCNYIHPCACVVCVCMLEKGILVTQHHPSPIHVREQAKIWLLNKREMGAFLKMKRLDRATGTHNMLLPVWHKGYLILYSNLKRHWEKGLFLFFLTWLEPCHFLAVVSFMLIGALRIKL